MYNDREKQNSETTKNRVGLIESNQRGGRRTRQRNSKGYILIP